MIQPKVALVYDWATTKYGGAENVLEAFHQAFPQAPLFTSVVNPQAAPWVSQWQVIPSFLQKIPGATQHHRLLALLLPLAFEAFDLSHYDIIISITSASAKGIITHPKQLHVSYILTPPRYVYSHRVEYLPQPMLRFLAHPFLKYLRWWDETAAQRPDKVIAISKLVAQRIKDYYQRPVDEVIYPPITLPTTRPKAPRSRPYFLVVSRLVAYKRLDLVIAMAIETGYELVIIGDGPQLSRLQTQAQGHSQIQFLGHQSPEMTAAYLAHCIALLMPGIEDFGITAAEAVAYGRPTIVHQKSGVAEILSRDNAVFLTELTVASLKNACQKVLATQYNQVKLRQSVAKYATTTFVKKITATIEKYWSSQI